VIEVPANGYLDISGRDFKCNRGYARAGEACAPIALPDQAYVDASGNGWACGKPYRREGSICVLQPERR
jgi:hypothetical protein